VKTTKGEAHPSWGHGVRTQTVQCHFDARGKEPRSGEQLQVMMKVVTIRTRCFPGKIHLTTNGVSQPRGPITGRKVDLFQRKNSSSYDLSSTNRSQTERGGRF